MVYLVESGGVGSLRAPQCHGSSTSASRDGSIAGRLDHHVTMSRTADSLARTQELHKVLQVPAQEQAQTLRRLGYFCPSTIRVKSGCSYTGNLGRTSQIAYESLTSGHSST
jgi:hypothetical protein